MRKLLSFMAVAMMVTSFQVDAQVTVKQETRGVFCKTDNVRMFFTYNFGNPDFFV